MSDLVSKLQAVDHMSVEDCFLQSPLFGQAAAEITRLQKELETAREDALEEAAKVADNYVGMGWRGDELPAAIRALKDKEVAG